MNGLEESDWEILLDRIRGGRCTPFLGAGACFGALPLGGDVARVLAAKFSYPLPNPCDLTAVTQYLSIVRDPAFAKTQVLDVLKRAGPPNNFRIRVYWGDCKKFTAELWSRWKARPQ